MNVLHLTKENFDQTVAQGVTLVDFFAQWCGPCKMLAPVIDRLGEKFHGKATVAKIDIDDQMDLASQFGVMTIPTVLVFKDGKVVSQIVGMQSEAKLTKMVEESL